LLSVSLDSPVRFRIHELNEVQIEEGKEVKGMRKLMSLIFALMVIAMFAYGCAGVAKDAKIKCPKCGAVFTVDEGLEEYMKKAY
jgi:hypothetical protein